MERVIAALLFILLGFSVTGLGAEGGDNKKYDATYGAGEKEIRVATGSPGSLGLLKALAEPFCHINHCRIHWIKKGSGAALKALKDGEVEVVMVHAPEAEKKAVEEGWATMRSLIGCNEFFVLGPGADPAGIKRAKSAEEVFGMIAKAQARFFSRGDNSGTHKKEMLIWQLAGIKTHGPWYIITGDFMGPTLMRADNELGYFMVDSSTFLAERSKLNNLEVLFKEDPSLINLYHAMLASPERHPKGDYKLSIRFMNFITAPEGQKIIREYGKENFGSPLYHDAGYAKKVGEIK